MGIKSEKVLRRYTHFSVEALRDVVVVLDGSAPRRRLEGRTGENWLLQFYDNSVGGFLVVAGKYLKILVELKGIEPSAS